MFLEPSKSQPARRRRLRGFTLIELVVVVVIIGISAALAVPTINKQLKEKASRETAIVVGQLYSNARMRAMGRGSAVTVVFANGNFIVRESIEGAAATARAEGDCASSPGRGCLTTNWANAANWREVGAFVADPGATMGLTITPKRNAVTQTQVQVCFTPGGRSFVSFDNTNPTTPFTGSIEFEVLRPNGLLRRTVLLPNGMARLAL